MATEWRARRRDTNLRRVRFVRFSLERTCISVSAECRKGVIMNPLYITVAIAAGVALLVGGLSVLVWRRGWFSRRRRGLRSQKPTMPKRLWRRGGKYNYMELFEAPDGNLAYHVHRAYEVKCPRCLEANSCGWLWTMHHQEGVDPVPSIGSPRLSFRCKRCKDVHSFVPQLGPSEWTADADVNGSTDNK